MKETDLIYFFPYKIEKQFHFRDKLKNRDSFFDEMEGENEYYYKDDANYGHRRNREHLSLLECSLNDYVVYDLFINWERWFKNGRNIFSFSKELLEMLQNTDVDDVTYESFKLPFDYFYLSLRPLELKISKDSDKIIEGVYIEIDRMSMEKSIDKDGNVYWNDYAVGFHFVGDFEEYIIKYHDKVWNDYGSGGRSFWHFAFYFSKKENIVTVSDAIKDWQSVEEYSLFPENKDEITDEHLDILNYYRELVNSSYKIIVNCMLYLSMNRTDKDIETQYAKDLPCNFNKKLQFAKTEKEKSKIEKKIAETGFSKINFVGNTYKNSANRNNETSNINVSPHWRRGHWRNQRYGENLAEKKLIWIKPVIVNRDIGTPQKGHIYKT